MRFSGSAVLFSVALAMVASRASGDEMKPVSRVQSLPPLSGPGIRVSLRDNARAVAVSKDGASSGLVHDYELQQLVKDLRAAKARGIAVNGVRLNTGTPIRAIGPRIYVGVRPIDNPFRVEAVGDSEALQKAVTAPGGTISGIRQANTGPSVSVDRISPVELPSSKGASERAVASKFLIIFRANGVTTERTMVSKRGWDSAIVGDSTRRYGGKEVLVGNALVSFGNGAHVVSVTADTISFNASDALFTLTGHVVFTEKRHGKVVARRTADKATFDLRTNEQPPK